MTQAPDDQANDGASFIEHFIPQSQGRIYARDYPGTGPAFARMAARFFQSHARNAERLPALKALDVPVKLIWGRFDPYLGVAMAENRLAQLKHGSLKLLPGGHWVQSDIPEQVAREMLS